MVDNLDINKTSKTKLKTALKKFKTLFGGGLGKLNMEPINIKLKPNSTPYTGRYYNVPKAYETVFKKEVV